MQDMDSGTVMNRLVQGDVGSGKTLVAAALIWHCAENGYCSAFMAPTEILAEQHYPRSPRCSGRWGFASGGSPAP